MTQVRNKKSLSAWLLLLIGMIYTIIVPAAAQDSIDFDYFDWSRAEQATLPATLLETLEQDPSAQLLLTGLSANNTAYLVTGSDVQALTIDGDTATPQMTWPLPATVDAPSAALLNGELFLLSSAATPQLWTLDVSSAEASWQPVGVQETPIAGQSSLTALNSRLFVTSDRASVVWDPANTSWTTLSPSPEALAGWTSVGVGSTHIAFFNRLQADTRTLLYHVVTDQWFYADANEERLQVLGTVQASPGFSVVSTDGIFDVAVVQPKAGLRMLDYIIVIGLFSMIFLIGLRYSGRSKSTHDYFRSSKAIPWWAAALSIFATSASAITVMAMPAMSFRGDWTYLTIAIYLVIIQVPLYTFLYVPIIRRLNFPSANQYLENRFGFSVRFLGFLGFSLNQILGRAAAILLLPAVAINAIFGLPIIYCILIMGLCTTIFVALGGFEAVVWTDVFLALIMVAAIVGSLAFAVLGMETTPAESIALIDRLDKLKMFDLRIDFSAPVALVLFLNSLVTSLGYIGDQNFVQRVQSTKTQKGAKLAAVSQLGVAVPLNFVLFGLGTVLFLYYSSRPEILSPAMPPDGIFPFFAATALPPGMAGLVVIALLAATISTVSSALSSTSNIMVEDLYRRLNPNATDASALRLGKWLTVGLGLFATGAAVILSTLSGLQSIWDLFLAVTGLIVGPVTGTFVLGIFSRRTNAAGIWAGVIASIAANFIAKTYFDLHATVFLTVGVFTCIIVGYAASWLFPSPTKDLTGLTIRKG